MYGRFAPDIVLMDLKMPEMDGYEAARLIRGTDSGKKAVVVAVTANVLAEGLEDTEHSGFNARIFKPFKEEEVFEAVGLSGAEYIYEGDAEPEPHPVPCGPVSPLPDGLVGKIREAAMTANLNILEESIEEVRACDPHLAARLRKLLDVYDYDAILSLIADKASG